MGVLSAIRLLSALAALVIVSGCGSTPTTDTTADTRAEDWIAVQDPPLSPRGGTTMVWTGRELVVFGGVHGVGDGTTSLRDGAIYLPADGAWHEIDPIPMEPAPASPSVLFDGSRVIVLTQPCAQDDPEDAYSCRPSPYEAAALDPSSGKWLSLPVPEPLREPRPGRVPRPVGAVDGRAVFATSLDPSASAEDSFWAWDGETWEEVPRPRVRGSEVKYCTTSEGIVAVAETSSVATVLEHTEDEWRWSSPASSRTATGEVVIGCTDEGVIGIPRTLAPEQDVARFDADSKVWEPASTPPPYEPGYPFVVGGGTLAVVPRLGLVYDWREDDWRQVAIDAGDRIGNAVVADGHLIIERVGQGQDLHYERVPLASTEPPAN